MANPSKFVLDDYLNNGQRITLSVQIFIYLSVPSCDPLGADHCWLTGNNLEEEKLHGALILMIYDVISPRKRAKIGKKPIDTGGGFLIEEDEEGEMEQKIVHPPGRDFEGSFK